MLNVATETTLRTRKGYAKEWAVPQRLQGAVTEAINP